ncbi:hypothetical protein BJ508DRAFT_120992 [Ascobolus immersus RN42]|uniref:Uncharacterized protein n=1 Tax=Ascobolus immersus RN42 TaxID=1160509 RepID=A0A3N4IMC4_ASCIM|nr:hypothetical protein BJ508DRAFT_120992 [Ascobolus immersus RN42]
MPTTTEQNAYAKIRALRKDGNELFAQGKLVDAAAKYVEAFTLDPTQSGPLHTLSKAQFELGNYSACLETIEKALELETKDDRKHNLAVRRVQCYVYMGNYEKAEDCLVGMKRDARVKRLAYALERGTGGMDVIDCNDGMHPLDIPRHRASLLPEGRDWFPRGHDDPKACIPKKDLMKRKTEAADLQITMFFGGVGDGRHALHQLHHIHAYDKEQRLAARRQEKFYLVCQDIQVHALAKLAIIFRILHEVSTATTSEEKELLLATAIFGYGSDIMPKYIRNRLNKIMVDLVADAQNVPSEDEEEPEEPGSFGIPWLRVNEKTKAEICEILSYWSNGAPGIRLQKAFNVQFAQSIPLPNTEFPGTPKPFRGMAAADELDQWRTSRVAYPTAGLLARYEPDLAQLMRKVKKKKASLRAKDLGEYARKHWVPNITILQDPEWYMWGHEPEVGATLDEIVSRIYEQLLERPKNWKQCSMLELIMPWFETVAEVLGPKSGVSITIELHSDEVSHLLDTVQLRTKLRFDSVYVGNLPDYIGGHLFTVLHCLPVLKQTGFVQSKILMNMGAFNEGLSRTFAEYLYLPDAKMADSLLGLKRLVTEDDQAGQLENMSSLMSKMGMPKFIGLGHPHTWQVRPPTTKYPPVEKPDFCRWLVDMFFKLAMPVPREYFGPNYSRKIEQPLTLYSFIRLCIYLVEDRRFPPHWVGEVIDQLLSTPDQLYTGAHPPRTAPIQMEEINNPPGERRLRPYDIRPFMPELRVLVAQYEDILPFPVLAPILIGETIQLRRFSAELEVYDMSIGPTAQLLALCFLAPTEENDRLWNHPRLAWERYSRVCAGEKKENECIIMSVFHWTLLRPLQTPTGTSSQRGIAEFVMEGPVIDRMLEGEWNMGLFRTDKWVLITELEPVAKCGESNFF